MKRRTFLKDAALAAVAGVAATQGLLSCNRSPKKPSLPGVAADFSFRADGSFTLLQFTDTHIIADDPRSQRGLACMKEALEVVKPDLVIHTGDILFGKPDLASAREALQILSDSGIPWAVTLGNHDAQFGSTRDEVFALIRSLPGNVNTPPKEDVYGLSNDVLTLSGAQGVERAFYLFDTMDSVVLKGEEQLRCYDYLRLSQLAWYRAHSERLAARHGGEPVPALAFMHIPPREVKEALEAGGELIGNNFEAPCPSRLNSGLVAQLREMQDVEAVVTGHDHDCDYVLRHGPLFYIYGRYSGGDTVYNHLSRSGYTKVKEEKVSGCRLFRFQSGEAGFQTCIRLFGGEIQQNARLQDGAITLL